MEYSNPHNKILEDIHSHSALNLNLDKRKRNLFDETDNFNNKEIKSNKKEIFNKNIKKDLDEDKETKLYLNHKNTDKIKFTSNEEIYIDDENFHLNSENNKINPRAERNKPYSQFYEEYNKKTRYIPIDNDNNTGIVKMKISDSNVTKNSENSENTIITLPKLEKMNLYNSESKLVLEDICNDGEIKIGTQVLIPDIETNRENTINFRKANLNLSQSTLDNKNLKLEDTQLIEDELESSLIVPHNERKKQLYVEKIKPVSLAIIDAEGNTSTEKVKKETSNPAIQYCRICYEEESDEKGGLIYPCHCTGSCQYIHENCLKKWIENNFIDHKIKAECEICKHEYNMKFYIKWQFSKQKFINTLKSIFGILLVTSIILSLVFTVIYVVVTSLSSMSTQEKTNFINILVGVGGGIVFFFIILSLRKCRKNFYEQKMCDWRIFNLDGSKIFIRN